MVRKLVVGGFVLALSLSAQPSRGRAIISADGTDLPSRARINFAGAGITCADNSVSGRTDCTIAAVESPAGPTGPMGPPGPAGADGATGVPGYSPNALTSFGGVAWLSDLVFRVSSNTYIIGGVTYTNPQIDLTLAAADGSNPRIDVIVVNSSSVAAVVAGTPAASPSLPDIDPATQIALTWVYVDTSATEPTNITLTNIYQENAEWAGTKSGTPINLASTSNPLSGTYCIEITAGVAGNNMYFAAPSPFDPAATANSLVLNIRSKATWAAARNLQLYWANNTARRGSIVTINEGAFGFNSSTLGSYQQISIPITLFATNGLTANRLYIRLVGTGGTFGNYIDSITLQQGMAAPVAPAGVTWRRAWGSTIAYGINDAVSYGGSSWVAIGSNTNSAPSDVSTDWSKMVAGMVGDAGAGGTAGLVPTPGVGDAVNFLRGDATWAAAGGGGGSIKRGTYADLPTCDSSLTDVLYLVTTAPMSMHCNGTSYLPFWHNYMPGGTVANLTDFSTVVGAETATISDTTGGILVTTSGAQASRRTKAVAAAAPYRYRMCLDISMSYTTDSFISVFVTNLTQDKGYLYGFNRKAGGQELFVFKTVGNGSYSATLLNTPPVTGAGNWYPTCLGFRSNGTRFFFETSEDGINWATITDEAKASHINAEIERVGLNVVAAGGGVAGYTTATRFGTWSFEAP